MKLFSTQTLSAVSFAMVLACQSNSLHAQTNKLDDAELKTNEAIGLGSGIALGALVAGPAGAVVAGIVGILIADDINDETRLHNQNVMLQAKTTQYDVLKAQYAQVQTHAQKQLAAMESALSAAQQKQLTAMQSNIQFKTASFVIEDHYKAQLQEIAAHLKANPNLHIKLSGFADQRGDSQYNQILSEQRTYAVQDYLKSLQVNEVQIVTQAFGENEIVSSGGDHEGNFFDRRVKLQLSTRQTEQMTAANQP